MLKELLLLLLAGLQLQGSTCDHLLPVSCRESEHVVLGAPFTIQEDGTPPAGANSNCTFTTNDGVRSKDWTQDGSEYIFHSAGDYQYTCMGEETKGNLSVVPGLYTISLCRSCESKRGQYRVTTGDSIQWVLVPEREIEEETQDVDCTMMSLKDEGGVELLRSSLSQHRFEEAGTFHLSCAETSDITAVIVVTDEEIEESDELRPLLYTHVALMAAAFGVLFPLAAFLFYHGVHVAYMIIFPIGLALGICGLAIIAIYVELTTGSHFRFVIHSSVGVALLALCVLVMPVLLLHKRSRKFHFRASHVLAFFGMGNVLLGLAAFPASLVVSVTLCIVYAVWLIAVIGFYIFYPARPTKFAPNGKKSPPASTTAETVNLEMNSRNGSVTNMRKSSTNTDVSSRGPKPLTKNIISEEKMVQLRKKSMDFFEAQKHMRELNAELGIKHQLAKELDEDESFKVRMECKDSKAEPDSLSSDENDDLDNPRARFHQSQSSPEMELEDPFPSLDRNQLKRRSDTEDNMDEEDENDDKFNQFLPSRGTPPPSGSKINRASTFNFGGDRSSIGMKLEDQEGDNTSEKGGSLRITRHSKRARVKLENVFNKSADEFTRAPSFNITPSTPPLDRSAFDYSPVHRDESTDSTPTPTSNIPDLGDNGGRVSPAFTPSARPTGRRRRAGMVPPPLMDPAGPPTVSEQPLGACPFQSSLAVRNKSPSPRPIRRGLASSGPSGSSLPDDGSSPRPKKKVSVAQIEATFVPPTPVSLQPPEHLGLARSPSFNTMRNHQDAFADNAFRSVTQISQDAICCANSIGDIVFWSAGASKMFGYTPGEAIGSSLEMIIPQSYKEKHRKGIGKRADDTLKYIRKHSYAPEEQKHARLYAVHGVTKGGHEFPVEVNVTSFVLDGEIFFTGVISELAKPNKHSRNNSISSSSDINEISLKQRALAVGAQMKIAHQLRSAEHISQRELERVLKGSLGTSFEVSDSEIEQMINGIMKAGDPDDTGAISFVGLIQLLSKHQLYISESGLIARYGKTKGSQETHHQTRRQRLAGNIKQFFSSYMCCFVWLLLFFCLNLVMFAIGVGAYSRDARVGDSGWGLWAFGTGPVLSMNCVLILLPTLTSFIHAMRNSSWMSMLFPLRNPTLFHVMISFAIMLWTVVHLLTHFCSFGLDSTLYPSFREGIREKMFPAITGFLVLIVFTVMGVSSTKPLRSLARFIPFRIIHWSGMILFYILLLIHGAHYWNPHFYKWLIPAMVVFVLERIYRHGIVKKLTVNMKAAGRYDSVSRTALVELDVPKHFEYEPGQYVLLNLPKIGKFEWQPCHLSSGPKEDKLTIHIPFSNDIWFKKAFEYLKQNPHNIPPPGQTTNTNPRKNEKNARLSQITMEEDLANQIPAFFTGPYGPMENSKLLFKYKISTVVCGGDGPHIAKAIIKKFLDYRKAVNCHCGCQPMLSKLYFVWVIPSGNDFEWFTDYLSDLCEDEHLHRYLDIRVFLTNCDSAPDELASALLQLGLKTAGDKVTVRRPSQPQLNNLYHMTSYGLPDFTSLLGYISSHHASLWMESKNEEFGVFTVGELKYAMRRDLVSAITKSSKPGQLVFREHKIST